jgi:hypothetical protein
MIVPTLSLFFFNLEEELVEVLEKIKQQLEDTVEQGRLMLKGWEFRDYQNVQDAYQAWYVRAEVFVQKFLHDRIDEFKLYYTGSGLENYEGEYGIKAFLKGKLPYYAYEDITSQQDRANKYIRHNLSMQISILNAIKTNLDTIVNEIVDTIYYEYQEDELEAAKTILDINLRAAGALCGVVIEKHLKRLVEKNDLQPDKKNPGINWYSSKLREKNIITVSQKKKVDYMADIRNRCDHPDVDEPKREDITRLIEDTNWLIKSVI